MSSMSSSTDSREGESEGKDEDEEDLHDGGLTDISIYLLPDGQLLL